MRVIRRFAVLAALGVLGTLQMAPCSAAEDEGVAVAILYDTSGSMQDKVRDGSGRLSSKYVIGQRALEAVVRRLQTFATNTSSAPRKLAAGLYAFSGDRATELVRFGPFDPSQAGQWTRNLPRPSSGTPIGTALESAAQALLKSNLSRKHILVITDGMNTVGADPAKVLPRLQTQAAGKQTRLDVHFVAFDVDARVFNPLKKLGVTVVGAADERQLNTQLGFILEKKILLEDEEPLKPR